MTTFAPEDLAAIADMAQDIIELEQYADFVRNRLFRRTLLCRVEQPVSRTLKPARLRTLYMASQAAPEASTPDIWTNAVEKFRAPDGAILSLDHPLSKAAMLCLGRHWPAFLSFDAIVAAAQALLDTAEGAATSERSSVGVAAASQDHEVLAVNLLKAFTYSDKLVELHAGPPRFTLDIDERPLASPWARRQAAIMRRVTNLRHEQMALKPYEQHLLQLLDGGSDRAALVAGLEGPVRAGALVIQQGARSVVNPDRAMALVAARLDTALGNLARSAFLMPNPAK